MERHPEQRQVALDALCEAVAMPPGEVPTVSAGPGPAQTAATLDAATRETEPPLVVVTGDEAAEHARAWAADRSGWLALDEPPAGHAVLAPVTTLARDPMPPGRWRGGVPAPQDSAPAAPVPSSAQAGELARAFSARAALVDSQRHEADLLRAQLIEQRAWVAAEITRVRASQSWRLGHRLVQTARLLTFRRGHGTDALQRIADRMDEPPER